MNLNRNENYTCIKECTGLHAMYNTNQNLIPCQIHDSLNPKFKRTYQFLHVLRWLSQKNRYSILQRVTVAGSGTSTTQALC